MDNTNLSCVLLKMERRFLEKQITCLLTKWHRQGLESDFNKAIKSVVEVVEIEDARR